MALSRLHVALAVSLMVLGSPTLEAQRAAREINKRQDELKQLRTDIQAFERKLKESEKKERSALERLDDLERQAMLIKQLIARLREEELHLTSEIDSARVGITELEERLQFLQSHYANYVRSVYKNGRIYDLEALFSSKSINQLSIRIQYLRRFSEQRARDLHDIETHKSELEAKNEELQSKLISERQIIADKTREEQTLQTKTGERRKVLRQIRRDKDSYKRELARKTAAFRQVERLIADLIEKERVRAEKEEAARKERELAAARARTTPTPEPPPSSVAAGAAFAERKGRLRWPVQTGTVKSKFGNQIHPVLKTVTENAGIDIATPQGSNVHSVADGEISVVSFIPGFGNLIIINHFGGYRTVYAHLADVLVKESQNVQEGTLIARSGETVDQPLLHFELWKEREKQNPEVWLAKRR